MQKKLACEQHYTLARRLGNAMHRSFPDSRDGLLLPHDAALRGRDIVADGGLPIGPKSIVLISASHETAARRSIWEDQPRGWVAQGLGAQICIVKSSKRALQAEVRFCM